ncbi:MAG: RimK family alpha-L-glutamate ligase [Candidatus Aenigmarchaeota archaeon]|nr:RimK family alpha-L-glutamate ligase [Candidatus Aenigmarchaeota archaeon]
MKLAILGPLNRGYEEIRLMKEGKKVFNSVSYFPIPQVTVEISEKGLELKYKRVSLKDFDCVLPRIPRTYKTFGYTLLTLLKEEGIPIPIEPISVFTSHNKFLTLLVLKEHNLPVPKTFLALDRNVLEPYLDELKYPVVLKLLYGSLGKGVVFADSKQSALSMMDALERFKEPIFVEEFIKANAEDIRVYIVGYEVAGSMKRIAKEGERRSNIGIGGTGVKYEAKGKIAEMAIKAAMAMGMEICGIDIMEGPKGPVIIETNVNAQFHGLEKATGINVAKKIINYMKEKVKR